MLQECVVTSKYDTVEDMMSYNEILDYIQSQDDQDQIEWCFKHITSHEGPLPRNYPNCNGSLCNMMMQWENGEITSCPLSVIADEDPVTCTLHAKACNLLKIIGYH